MNAISSEIICAECPDIYATSDITAYTTGDAAVEKPLVELLRSGGDAGEGLQEKTNVIARLFATHERGPATLGVERSREALRNREKLKNWRFRCPNGHPVDGSPGSQFVLAVVGASGSSKSHVLPGLLWETDALERLRPLGVTVRRGQWGDIALEAGQRDIYQQNQVLPATSPTDVLGPYAYRLSLGSVAADEALSLLLFDVGGEAVSNAAGIGEYAKYVLLAKAIIYLIDPQGVFPTKFDDGAAPSRNRQIAAVRQRCEAIRQTADALESVWGPSMNGVGFVFAIAKADSLTWDFPWEAETDAVLDGARAGVSDALSASSKRVRDQLVEVGGVRIVNEIEERFPAASVRFAALAATSQMPRSRGGVGAAASAYGDEWDDPEPRGIALALLHALDLSGKSVRAAGH